MEATRWSDQSPLMFSGDYVPDEQKQSKIQQLLSVW